jgi:NAD(P)-dependent dehydrogenase (short-subunit alcohol dehydrogenase family)
MTLATEEPSIRSIAVDPGVVDTEMQRQLREVYASAMDKKDVEFFKSLHEKKRLLAPWQPAGVIADLVLRCPESLRGKCVK